MPVPPLPPATRWNISSPKRCAGIIAAGAVIGAGAVAGIVVTGAAAIGAGAVVTGAAATAATGAAVITDRISREGGNSSRPRCFEAGRPYRTSGTWGRSAMRRLTILACIVGFAAAPLPAFAYSCVLSPAKDAVIVKTDNPSDRETTCKVECLFTSPEGPMTVSCAQRIPA